MAWTSLFPAAELADNMIRLVRISGKKIILVRQAEQIYALEGTCSHEDYSLAEGFLEQGKICCSLHGSAFELASGAALSPPAFAPVATYPVEVREGIIWVRMP